MPLLLWLFVQALWPVTMYVALIDSQDNYLLHTTLIVYLLDQKSRAKNHTIIVDNL